MVTLSTDNYSITCKPLNLIFVLYDCHVIRLSERCKSHPHMDREAGMQFIESLAELLRRLLDYRTVQQGDRDLHMHVMFNLLVRQNVCVCAVGGFPHLKQGLSLVCVHICILILYVYSAQNFYKEMGREEIYIR